MADEEMIPDSVAAKTRASLPFALMAAMVLGAAIVALIGAKAFSVYTAEPAFAPFYGDGFDKPESVAEHTIAQGQTLHVTATKCYRENVSVYGQSNWHRITEPVLEVIHTQPSAVAPKPKGCETHTFAHLIPADLPPGQWELAGIDTAASGTKSSTRTWVTEPFTVTAAQ